MPNWCSSTLEITGPENEIKSIVDTELDFEKILPTPADLSPETYDKLGMTEFQRQANLAVYGCEDWYDWHISNWGTKWNPTSENRHKRITLVNPGKIDVELITAWSLPLNLLVKVSKDHPNTTIHIVDCEEEAGFFVGDCKILNGEIIEDNIHEPSQEELRDRGMLDEEEEE